MVPEKLFLVVKDLLVGTWFLGCKVSLEAVFLVELTSFVHLTTLKIAKFLVISESGFPSAAVVLHDVPLVLVDKGSIRILPLVNQNKTILSYDKFKAKLVNLLSGCTAFEISDMIFQVGGQTCFIPCSSKSGYCSQFALVTFGSQADLDSAIVKTEMSHLAANCKVFSPSSPKLSKMFTPCFVGPKSYAKTSAPLSSSGFLPLLSLVFSSVAVDDPLVLSRLSFLESDLTKLSVLVESIVKSIGFLVATFEQFINGDLVSSSAFGLKINKILVHMGSFSKTVGKLEREVVSLKKECCIENIDISGDSELSPIVSDKVFSNLMFFWEHESVVVKTDPFKTAK
ncbi:hypothetical protein G9A89_018636 [Geosiphon pyriformis]|nr:hypothetical protein G9A89_018636 [Geosiphon pyriformis]